MMRLACTQCSLKWYKFPKLLKLGTTLLSSSLRSVEAILGQEHLQHTHLMSYALTKLSVFHARLAPAFRHDKHESAIWQNYMKLDHLNIYAAPSIYTVFIEMTSDPVNIKNWDNPTDTIMNLSWTNRCDSIFHTHSFHILCIERREWVSMAH